MREYDILLESDYNNKNMLGRENAMTELSNKTLQKYFKKKKTLNYQASLI